MHKLAATCLIVFFSGLPVVSAFAQPGAGRENNDGPRYSGTRITGRIIDGASRDPIEYANIRVCSASDSTLLTGTVSKKDGSFSLTAPIEGALFVDVRFLGYQQKIVPIDAQESRTIDLGQIVIEADPVQMKEVLIEGGRVPISYRIDKKVIDVRKMQTVISGTAADVLQNIPSVSVDLEGNVSLRGSTNFTVLIDGRPTVLTAQEALQQIPASSVETIEIITNPSAKYDPEGTSGIVNIITRKDPKSGLSGVVNTGAGVHESYGGDFVSQYRTESFTVVVGGDHNRRNFPGTSRSENTFTTAGTTRFLRSDGTNEAQRRGSGFRSSIAFDASENTLVTVGGRLGYRGGVHSNELFCSEWSGDDPSGSSYLSIGRFDRGGNYYEANLSAVHRFDESGHELKVEGNFGYDEDNESSLTTEQSGMMMTGGERLDVGGLAREFEGKMDYTLPFTEGSKFESGYEGEAEVSEESNHPFRYNIVSQAFEPLSAFDYSVRYRNSDHALYSTYAGNFLGLGFQAGLRTEYTFRSVILDRKGQRFTIDRWDLFPTLHASTKLSEVTQAMASYTRRIQRPHGWEMEPYVIWTDANNVRKGNPDLQPQFIDSYETGLQTIFLGVPMTADLYYRIVHNKIERIKSVYQPGITLTSMGNIGHDRSIGGEYMMMVDFFRMWNVNVMANLYDYQVEGILPEGAFARSSFNWSARCNNVLNIDRETQIQVNVNYNSPTVSSQGKTTESFSVDLAAKRTLFDRFLTVTLQVRDLFGTSIMEGTSQGSDFFSYTYAKRESPLVMLNLRWNFNNFEQEENDEAGYGRGEEGRDNGGDAP